MKKMSEHLSTLATVALGLGVFCFWFFGYPYILTSREQSALFIWDSAYLSDRLSMPWGWLSLLTTFVCQFFNHPLVGAMLLAALAVALAAVVCWLWRLVTPRFPWSAKLVATAVALFVTCWLPLHPSEGTDEEMTYDYLMRQGRWQQICEKAQQQPPQSLACQNMVRLAMFQLGQLSEQALFEGLTSSNKVLADRASAFIMSDVYMNMGMVNMSQRAAFEAMESIEDYNKSGRALKRLVETSLITGQYEVCLKYISILEHTLYYHVWAQRIRHLAEHPELVAEHPTYGRCRQMYQQTKDVFFY